MSNNRWCGNCKYKTNRLEMVSPSTIGTVWICKFTGKQEDCFAECSKHKYHLFKELITKSLNLELTKG